MFDTYINGLGAYAPEKIIDNAWLEKIVDTSDEWIVSRTGIKERHMAAPDEMTSDLALKATLAALKDSQRNANQITHIILTTCNPDSLCPSTACVLAGKLGLGNNIMAVDVNAACSGFITGLQLANCIANTDENALVLLVAAEIMTSKCDWTDRSTCVLFGDGAGAVLISKNLPASPKGFSARIKDIMINCDGSLADLLTVYAGGTKLPYKVGDTVGTEYFVCMEGREIFKHAVRNMVKISTEVLERTKLTVADLSLVIPHQANQRIIEAVGQRLEVPAAKLFSNVEHYGNTSSASVPIALFDARRENLLAPGGRVLITAFGGGLTWSASLLEVI